MLSKRMTEKRRDATAVAAIRTRMINRSRPLVLRPVSPLKKLLPTLAAMVLSILEWYWKAGRHKHKRTPKLPAPPASTTRQSVPTPDLPAKSVSPPHLSRLKTSSISAILLQVAASHRHKYTHSSPPRGWLTCSADVCSNVGTMGLLDLSINQNHLSLHRTPNSHENTRNSYLTSRPKLHLHCCVCCWAGHTRKC